MEIVVPELGESIVEATVARWLKKEGERVSVGEALVELETDKVDLEVGAKEDGVLAEIQHQEGEDVQVGDVLGRIEAAPAGEREEEPQEAEAQATAQPEAEKQPAKAEAQAEPQEEEVAEAPQPPGGDGAGAERATPVARRMALEQGIDLSEVQASGPGQRVTKQDVRRYLESEAPAKEKEAPAKEAPQAERRPAQPEHLLEEPSAERRETRERMSRRRRTIASRLVEVQQTAAMLTTFNDVDMSAVIELRNRRKSSFQEKHGVKLGFMSFFVKASIGALKDFPRLNAEIQGDEIVYKHYYDIGIAVGAEEGLVVPVLRDAQNMSFAEIESTIRAFIEKTQNKTLSLEDLRGGTFSITNGGVFGSLLSTPILNPPQVGILGLHRIEERPVAVDGRAVVRPMMYLALSYDHRIVDGREAVQFLVRLKELIEDPEALLLEM
ncbi:MAG: 2-oxoglutarate dehydrogenase complex dihydrolipoyllysine-residue succinyltransferase [Anaerolineales bacterium]